GCVGAARAKRRCGSESKRSHRVGGKLKQIATVHWSAFRGGGGDVLTGEEVEAAEAQCQRARVVGVVMFGDAVFLPAMTTADECFESVADLDIVIGTEMQDERT